MLKGKKVQVKFYMEQELKQELDKRLMLGKNHPRHGALSNYLSSLVKKDLQNLKNSA